MTTSVQEITVQFVNSPRPGKKLGSIKASEGMTFYCQPAMLKEFSVGETCKVEYTSKVAPPTADFPNATEFHTLTKKLWAGDRIIANPTKSIARPRMDPVDARGAAITSAFNAYVAAGKIPLNKDAIATARQEIGLGYDQSLDQNDNVYNDHIPNWEPAKSENPAD